MVVMHGFGKMKFHSPRLTCLWPALSTQCASHWDQHWTRHMTPFYIGWLHWSWCQVNYIEPYSSREGQTLYHWNRHLLCIPLITGIDTLDINLSSLYTMILPKIPSKDLQNALFTVVAFHAALLLINELASQQKKCGRGPMLVESLVLPCSPPSISIEFERRVEQHFEDSVTMSPRGQYLARLRQGSTEDYVCSESMSTTCYSFSSSRDSCVQESRAKNEVVLFIITSNDPLAKFSLLLPTGLCSPGLEV